MSSVNKAILVGNLGADVETFTTRDGRKIASLRVATSENWRDKASGERRERTEWHKVVIFSEGLADVAEKYLHKGSKVYIEGQLQTRKWEKDGQDHYSTEVVLQGFGAKLVMLDSKPANSRDSRDDRDDSRDDRRDDRNDDRGRSSSNDRGKSSDDNRGRSMQDELDDEIPF